MESLQHQDRTKAITNIHDEKDSNPAEREGEADVYPLRFRLI